MPNMDLLARAKVCLAILATSESADDFCRGLVHTVLADVGAVAAFICRVEGDSTLFFFGRYGYDHPVFHGESPISIWEPRAVTNSIRENRFVEVNSRDEYVLDYDPKNALDVPGNGFVAIPLRRGERPLGGLGIAFAGRLQDMPVNADTWKVVQLAAEVLASGFWSNRTKPGNSLVTAPLTGEQKLEIHDQLSRRQLTILRMISDGLTNKQIASELRVSESTVKQEAVKIFRILQVSTRGQARTVAKALNLNQVIARRALDVEDDDE